MRLIVLTIVLTLFSTPAWEAEETIPGLIYRQDKRIAKHSTEAIKQIIHTIEIDPSKFKVIAAHAKNTARAREALQNIAKQHGAIVAINGGFFKRGIETDGLPAGVLKIKNQWYGLSYRKRAAIGWSTTDKIVLVDRIQTKTRIFLNYRKFPINALNHPGLKNRAILYTPAYGEKADSFPGNIDIIIEDNYIKSIVPAGGHIIPKNGYIYSSPLSQQAEIKYLSVNDPVEIDIIVHPDHKTNQNDWQNVNNIIGGAPLLVYQGHLIQDYAEERVRNDFLNNSYARTALGILKNGHWVFVVVENNIFNHTQGFTITELAQYMHQLGCEYALNLDGGGSSTLYVKDNVVNHPQGDIDEGYGITTIRPISDAILVLPKTP